MSPLQYFRKQETEHGNTTIGDKHEGFVIKNFRKEDLKNVIIDYKGKKVDITKGLQNGKDGYSLKTSFASEDTNKWGIFCYTILRIQDKNIFNIKKTVKKFLPLTNEMYIKHVYVEKKSFANRLNKEVGGTDKYPIIIRNSFFSKLKKYSIRNKLPIAFGPVTYYPNNVKSNVSNYKSEEEQAVHAVFQKNEKYYNQREGRIVLYKNSRFLKLGNISKDIIKIADRAPIISMEDRKLIKICPMPSIIVSSCSNILNQMIINEKRTHYIK